MFSVMWFLPIVSSYYVTLHCPDQCICDNEITRCSGQSLTTMPTHINSDIRNLDLSWNEFGTFPSDVQLLSELRSLNLSHNKISTLRNGQIEALVKLETIDLTYNLFHDWKDIHSGIFQPAKNLLFLDLSHNPLRTLSKYSNHFYIPSLEVLRLVNCSMRIIPANVFQRLTNLTELYLSDNPISNISDNFTLENLRLMEISRTRLSVINENVFTDLPNLETLIMNNNINLRRFPCHSSTLRYLDLSNSMLEQIPNGHMEKLLRLDLSGNYLKKIPTNGFIALCSLQMLNLSTNAITVIDFDAFQGLTEVQSIDLSFNKLISLGEQFNNNSALTFLNLSHNYISELHTLRSKSLKALVVSFCEIYELNKYSLSLMPNLIRLTMSRNFLTRLPDRLVARNLVILDLSYCRMNTLSNETFSEMFYLREINLANNALTSIDPSYFPRAFKATIKDNPWRCNCKKIKKMFEWMTAYNSDELDALVCYSPEPVAGQTWEQACENEWYPNQITRDTMWYYSLGIVVAMVLALFGLVVLRKVKSLQQQRVRLEEEARRAEEREALSRMQERQREIHDEDNRNAPDPRELQRPPSYNEALLLPRMNVSRSSLAGSFHSLGSRGSLRESSSDVSKKKKNRRKRRRRKDEEERRASRITVESDSSEESQSTENLSSRRKVTHPLPLESDF
ncbi:insulin-like growth factor-binding protein complex acid labile subunit isoform X2 [Euwallacea fornicatus]|uniref:insulin-like growth factor-binding protein complex acid labile subunit isoform X2 n=1 Tax=Euwallacea fornicatus TaxID=995702 RepID=UPI00338D66C4